MKAVWRFPAEAASAMCNINLSAPGLDFVDSSSSCTCLVQQANDMENAAFASTSEFWSVRDTS